MMQLETVQAFRPIEELIPSHWTTVVINAQDSTPLHVLRTGGDKPAVILLHGIQTSGLMWLRTAKALETDFDVIMPDARGHGQSGNLDNGLSSELMVSDLITIIGTLKLQKPFVVGHSMGADAAGRLAAEADLCGAVLVDPALINIAAMMPPMSDELPPYMQPVLDAIETIRSGTHKEKMQAGLNLLPPGVSIPEEEDYVGFVVGHSGFDARVYKNLMAMGYLCEEPETIARIKCPLLLMTARPHMLSPQQFENGLAVFRDNWQYGKHSHFEDSGHFIPFERFERFTSKLRAFFAAS